MIVLKKLARGFGYSHVLAIVGLLLMPFAASGTIDTNQYLTAEQQIELLDMLPPPPEGAEQNADLASVRSVRESATPKQLAEAKTEGTLSLRIFAPAIKEFAQPGKFPEFEKFFDRIHRESDQVVELGKARWKRLRPLNADPTINQGVHDESYSYPSGHSTGATLYALLLAEIFPDQKTEIMNIGRQTGWHRVQLAMHYPTDIYAGRTLARAILRQLKTNTAFQHDFEQVQAEVAKRLIHANIFHPGNRTAKPLAAGSIK